MAIKRREKPLTPAEALELTRQAFAMYWFGCPDPLMAGVRDPNGVVRAYPIDSRMTEKQWLIFFIDPFSFTARDCVAYAKAWAHRYEPQKLGVMMISKLPYSFSTETDWGHNFAKQMDSPVVTAMDHQGLLHEAFKVTDLPRLMFMHQNKVIFDKVGLDWLKNAELEVQTYLRKTDPGLPLFEIIPEPENPAKDLLAADFVGLDGKTKSFDLPDGKKLTLAGEWKFEANRITTQDPAAFIEFGVFGKRVGVVAGAVFERAETEMIVELPREYPRDGATDDDLHVDIQMLSNPLADATQKRRSTTKLTAPRTYYLFRNLPPTYKEVTLRFPSADKSAVAVYGIRLGD